MGLGNYLAGLDLSPGVAEKLTGQYVRAPIGPVDDMAPPTADEMAKYGASPEDIAAAQRFNAPQGPTPMAATNPTAADPKWDPAVEAKALEAKKQRDALAAANPQGPMGSDGFPTYKDLSNPGQGPGGPGGGMVAMPVQRIPAHWQPGTRSYSAQFGMDPGELQSGEYHRDVASGQRMLASDKRLEAAQMQADTDVAYAERQAVAADQAAARLARIQDARAAYVADEKLKMEGLAQQASAKVDPEVVNGSLGGQLLAAIGIGLGQFGAAINGGPNTAYQIVQDNVNRRLKMEQDKINNARGALDARRSLYAQNLAEFGDKERASLATKVALLDQAKAAMDQQYAKSKGTANEAAYHEMVAMVETDRAQAADQFAKLTHTQRAEQGNEHYVPTQYVGGMGGGGGQKGKDDHFVPTLGGYARSKEDAAKLNEAGARRLQMNENMRQINGLMEEAKGLSSASPEGFLRLQQIDKQIKGLAYDTLQSSNVLAGQGAMSEGDKIVTETARNLEGAGAQFKTNGAIARQQENIKAAAVRQMRDHRLAGEAYGIRLGQEQYVMGPSGPEPRAVLQGKTKTVTKETQSYDDVVEAPKGKSGR